MIQKESRDLKKALKKGCYSFGKNRQNIISISPVIGKEEDVGRRHDDLKPTPVSDKIGEKRKDEVTNAEEHLEQYAHCSSVFHTNDLCD